MQVLKKTTMASQGSLQRVSDRILKNGFLFRSSSRMSDVSPIIVRGVVCIPIVLAYGYFFILL
jgi:hypothetical protein